MQLQVVLILLVVVVVQMMKVLMRPAADSLPTVVVRMPLLPLLLVVLMLPLPRLN